ncbi:hypothetical protein M9H77_23537 [Catharanthus roseus]|uniref:Uncharacterized protein n=1 Tax=Catharanthus roseus TaxID=4058 RepID=A0ACC0AVR2_CATRO|nr:hypothetical protein M9H77_23537 [Catharanthus roseus]
MLGLTSHDKMVTKSTWASVRIYYPLNKASLGLAALSSYRCHMALYYDLRLPLDHFPYEISSLLIREQWFRLDQCNIKEIGPAVNVINLTVWVKDLPHCITVCSPIFCLANTLVNLASAVKGSSDSYSKHLGRALTLAADMAKRSRRLITDQSQKENTRRPIHRPNLPNEPPLYAWATDHQPIPVDHRDHTSTHGPGKFAAISAVVGTRISPHTQKLRQKRWIPRKYHKSLSVSVGVKPQHSDLSRERNSPSERNQKRRNQTPRVQKLRYPFIGVRKPLAMAGDLGTSWLFSSATESTPNQLTAISNFVYEKTKRRVAFIGWEYLSKETVAKA